MNVFFEQPLYAIFLGILVESVLVMVYLQSGKRWLISVMVLVALLAGGGVMLERLVVTDRETVEATMTQIVADIESNDASLVLAHIAKEATKKRAEAERILALVKFRSVEIRRIIEIKTMPDLTPPQAKANFTVKPVVSDSSGTFEDFPAPRRLEVTFVKEGGDWRILDYKIFNLLGDNGNPLKP